MPELGMGSNPNWPWLALAAGWSGGSVVAPEFGTAPAARYQTARAGCSAPDFNPIENAFAKLKALLRKAAERTIEGLWKAIGRLIDTFTPPECANYFAAAGYDPT